MGSKKGQQTIQVSRSILKQKISTKKLTDKLFDKNSFQGTILYANSSNLALYLSLLSTELANKIDIYMMKAFTKKVWSIEQKCKNIIE